MMPPFPPYRIGLDLGSVSLDCVVLDAADRVVFKSYARTAGRPQEAALTALREMIAVLGDADASGAVVTGSGKELITQAAELDPVSEIVAHATAGWTKHPDAASIIEIGGQDSKYIALGRTQGGAPFLRDHSFNELCAAGTGAFLDQQAERLGLTIEQFGALARDAPRSARIAGRCSVFAKSDMIHLQQAAVPVEEIAAGLCRALARTYLAALCRGRAPARPILFQGGVACNPGVVKAFRDLLGLDAGGLIVPEDCRLMGAFGAAVMAGDRPLKRPLKLSALLEAIVAREAPRPVEPLPRLVGKPTPAPLPGVRGDSPVHEPVVMGIDAGSVSTKGVIVDSGHSLVAAAYLPTTGSPQAAIQEVIRRLKADMPAGVTPAHVMATGSGRHLTRVILQCAAVDEISAQSASAAFFFPRADTVFEIGGQDAKFLRVRNGKVDTFRMNRACAAGTGAFLEEQAARLGIRIAGEFADAAFRSRNPAPLGSRCTVFMDTDLVHHMQRGASRDDLCAGLAYAVAQNYIEKVVGSNPIGDRIIFQGGVAGNPAVRAAFERLLGLDFSIHPRPELSGALGAAFIALEELRLGRPACPAPELLPSACTSETFECHGCENSCGITRITVAKRRHADFGSLCGRFEAGNPQPSAVEDAFSVRERLLHACLEGSPGSASRGVIGLPLALTLSDHLPFWATFFRSLGFAVRPSGRTHRPIVEAGLQNVPAEFCYPVKLLFGHVHALLDRGVRRMFIPHVRMLTPPGERAARYACPYTQAVPYVVRENMPDNVEIVTLEYPVDGETAQWSAAASSRLGIRRAGIEAARIAASHAQALFQNACREAGRRMIDGLARSGRRGAVLIGRPYNTNDRLANLDLARRLARLGIEPIPFDFLPLESETLPPLWERIRWGYGRQLVKATRAMKPHPHLGAVIVTNFGCGPDAFVDQYLEHELKEIPHILIELDDHQAEAGLVTRLEAFARNFEIRTTPARAIGGRDPGEPRRPLREYTYYIPAFMDHAYAITGALKASGCRTVLLPPTDDRSWSLGLRHAYGRECHPFIAFTGDLLRAAERPDFKPAEACYFGPSYFGPCLLPQYPLALHLILEKLGLADVTVMNITDFSNMRALGPAYMLRLAIGLYAIDRMYKWKTEIEPREARAGEVRAVYREILADLERGLAEGSFFRTLKRSIARFERVPLSRGGARRPTVGIVGDVYTRVNEHSNDGLYRRLNRMGVDVWTSSSVIDVSLLAIEQRPAELFRKGRRLQALLAAGMLPALTLARRFIDRHFPAGIRTPQERHYPDVHRASSRYVSFWIDKVLSLNLNRIEELHAAGADGVINVMCHNCMLGTITASLSHSIRRNTSDTPLCTLVFEGLKSTHSTTRLEAFAHQLHACGRSRPDR